MAYKIAVASSDEAFVNLSFGAASSFLVYEVDGTSYHLAEKRTFHSDDVAGQNPEKEITGALPEGSSAGNGQDASADGSRTQDCGNGGCGTEGGCGGGGCGGPGGASAKVQLLSDCRCIVCQKIGFQVQKQLEKLAIVHFDVDCRIEEALDKITAYLDKVDNHQSLRGIARRKTGVGSEEWGTAPE